jgi:hypothetical protein
MSMIELCKPVLVEIADLLDSGGDPLFADVVRTGLKGSEESVDGFLISNDLWGGSGSVADSGFASASCEENRAKFQRLMIEIGRLQLAADRVNVRTRMWVEAFEQWRHNGIS